jgi:long-chain acyl-CoA synthetase
VRQAVLESLKEVAIKHGKKKFEFIKDCRLYPEEWTSENGLLTSAQKLKRSNLIKRYHSDICEMYKLLPQI